MFLLIKSSKLLIRVYSKKKVLDGGECACSWVEGRRIMRWGEGRRRSDIVWQHMTVLFKTNCLASFVSFTRHCHVKCCKECWILVKSLHRLEATISGILMVRYSSSVL